MVAYLVKNPLFSTNFTKFWYGPLIRAYEMLVKRTLLYNNFLLHKLFQLYVAYLVENPQFSTDFNKFWLVRNQVNYSPGTDQPKIRLARQLPKLRSGKTFWRQCKYCVVEGGEFG